MPRLQEFETFNATFVHTGHPLDVLIRMISVSLMARRRLSEQRPVTVSNPGGGEEVAVNVLQHLLHAIMFPVTMVA